MGVVTGKPCGEFLLIRTLHPYPPHSCRTHTHQDNQAGFLSFGLPALFLFTLVPSPNHMIPFNSLPAPALFLCNILMDHSSLDISPFSTQGQNLPLILTNSHLARYYIPSTLLGPLYYFNCDN